MPPRISLDERLARFFANPTIDDSGLVTAINSALSPIGSKVQLIKLLKEKIQHDPLFRKRLQEKMHVRNTEVPQSRGHGLAKVTDREKNLDKLTEAKRRAGVYYRPRHVVETASESEVVARIHGPQSEKLIPEELRAQNKKKKKNGGSSGDAPRALEKPHRTIPISRRALFGGARYGRRR